jgi:histidine triad (HIT) family protein
MASIFTKIAHKQIPAHIVAENQEYIAFLDIKPLVWGHTLVVPKQEIDYLFDLEDTTLGGLMIFAKKVALSLQKVVPCLRVGLAVVGLEVPHAHIHLLPLNGAYDIDFKKPSLLCSQEELAQLAEKIKTSIDYVTGSSVAC